MAPGSFAILLITIDHSQVGHHSKNVAPKIGSPGNNFFLNKDPPCNLFYCKYVKNLDHLSEMKEYRPLNIFHLQNLDQWHI